MTTAWERHGSDGTSHAKNAVAASLSVSWARMNARASVADPGERIRERVRQHHSMIIVLLLQFTPTARAVVMSSADGFVEFMP